MIAARAEPRKELQASFLPAVPRDVSERLGRGAGVPGLQEPSRLERRRGLDGRLPIGRGGDLKSGAFGPIFPFFSYICVDL